MAVAKKSRWPGNGAGGKEILVPLVVCVRRSAQLNPLIAGHALSGRPGPAFNGLGSDRLSPSKLETSGVLFTYGSTLCYDTAAERHVAYGQ